MFDAIINQRIFDTTIDLILVTDWQGMFIRISPSSQNVLGYDPSEMVGHSALEFIQHKDLENTRNEMRLIRRGKVMRHFPCRYVHRDGHDVLLRWTGVWDDQTKQHFFIGRDITAAQEAEQLANKLAEMTGILTNIDTEVKTISTNYWNRLGDLYVNDVLMTIGALTASWVLLCTNMYFPFLITFGHSTNRVWGTVIFTVSIMRIWGILCESLPSTYKSDAKIRSLSHLLSGTFWLIVGSSAAINNGDYLLSIVVCLIGVRSWWFAIRMWPNRYG